MISNTYVEMLQNDIDELERKERAWGAYQAQKNSDPANPAKSVESIRASVLTEALKAVTGQRQTDYGTVEDNFQNIANLWNAYFQTSSKGIPNINTTDVAAMMALMKVARLIHSPGHRDSWVDLAGYAACGAECGLKGTK